MAKKRFDRVSPSIIKALLKSGGTVGQVLVKGSEDDFDYSWENPGGIQFGFQGQAYAVWSGVGLIFNVFWPIYFINGISYPAGSTSLELDAADATHGRLDVIALDMSGALIITGTPSADPVKPTVDNLTQLEITTIFVGATSTTPDEVTDEDVYKENVEWTGSSDIAGAEFNNTTTPFAGTYCVDIDAFTAGKYVRFVDGSSPTTHDASEYSFLKFYVKLKATFATTAGFIITFKLGSTVVSSAVTITNGLYDFDRTDVSGYQLIAIPLSAFTFSSAVFDTINFEMKGSNGTGFKMDNIVLQSGISPANTDQNNITTIETDSGTVLIDRVNDTIRIVGAGGAVVSAVGKTITITAGGGGGTPGGTNGQIQYNNSGAFGGRDFIDDDTMATASATAIPSSESVKAYVDANALAGDNLDMLELAYLRGIYYMANK
jgi:hypothetical protein